MILSPMTEVLAIGLAVRLDWQLDFSKSLGYSSTKVIMNY